MSVKPIRPGHRDTDGEPDRSLQCAAKGCPNRWSINAGDGCLCSAHAGVGRSMWPQVTHQQVEAEIDRAFERGIAPPAAPPAPIDKAAVLRSLADMRESLVSRAAARGRGWTIRLRDCEAAGEKLTLAQREMWRDALGLVKTQPQEGHDDETYFAGR